MSAPPVQLRPLARSRDTVPRSLRVALSEAGCSYEAFGVATKVATSKVGRWADESVDLLPNLGHCLRAIEAGGAARAVVVSVLCWMLGRAGYVVHLQAEIDWDAERRVG